MCGSSTKTFPFSAKRLNSRRKPRWPSKAQGKHQVFHEAMLAFKGDITKESLLSLAGEVGLDTTKLEGDMRNPEWQKRSTPIAPWHGLSASAARPDSSWARVGSRRIGLEQAEGIDRAGKPQALAVC